MASTDNRNPTGGGTSATSAIPLHPFFALPDLGADGDFEGFLPSAGASDLQGPLHAPSALPAGGGATGDSDSSRAITDIEAQYTDADQGNYDMQYGNDTGSGGGGSGSPGGGGTGGNGGNTGGTGNNLHTRIILTGGYDFVYYPSNPNLHVDAFSGTGGTLGDANDASDVLITEIQKVLVGLLGLVPTDTNISTALKALIDLINNTSGGADETTLQRMYGVVEDIVAILKATNAIGGAEAMDFLASAATAITDGSITWEEASLILTFLATDPDLDVILLVIGLIEAAVLAFKIASSLFATINAKVNSWLNSLDAKVQAAMRKLYLWMLTH